VKRTVVSAIATLLHRGPLARGRFHEPVFLHLYAAARAADRTTAAGSLPRCVTEDLVNSHGATVQEVIRTPPFSRLALPDEEVSASANVSDAVRLMAIASRS
jgi:hypothetical protein